MSFVSQTEACGFVYFGPQTAVSYTDSSRCNCGLYFSFFFSLMEVGLHPDNTDRINSFLHQITEGVYCKNICTEYVIYKIVYPFVKPLYFHVYITPTYSLLILYHNAVYHDWKCKHNSLRVFTSTHRFMSDSKMFVFIIIAICLQFNNVSKQ